MFPQLILVSQPLMPQKFICINASPTTAHVYAKYDLLVWFEICELTPNGDYVPVVVDHLDSTPCRGTFLLHQGIQRRLRISVIHEKDADIVWKDIRELVLGRIRTQPEYGDSFDDDEDESILSLSLFPIAYEELSDNRIIYRFEAAWDTSLHNSCLMNRVTSGGERIFLTLSAYLEVSLNLICFIFELNLIILLFLQKLENCIQPAIITKDLCLKIYGRDARTFPRLIPNTQTLKHLISGAYKNADRNHISAVYELTFKRAIESGSPGVNRRQRKVLDTSGTYVRGEENLNGWQPKGDLLIFDHQWELEKIKRLELVERVRHMLLVREKLSEPSKDAIQVCNMKSSGSRMNLASMATPTSPVSSPIIDKLVYEPWTMSEEEKSLCTKCINIIESHIPTELSPSVTKKNLLQAVNNEESDQFSSLSSSPEMLSPDKSFNNSDWYKRSGQDISGREGEGLCMASLADPATKPVLVGEIEEIRLSAMVSRKGVIFVFDDKSGKLIKRWAVVRRPYLFIYSDEKDSIEKGLINLTNAQIECSENCDSFKYSKSFSIITKHRVYILQASTEKEIHDWLYAINPLLAGQIRSKNPMSTKLIDGQNDHINCTI